MRMVFFNHVPINLLVKNTASRGNLGIVWLYMLVMTFVDFIGGNNINTAVDIVLALMLTAAIFNSYKEERDEYEHIWLLAHFKMEKILLCDPGSLSEEELEVRKGISAEDMASLGKHVSIIAAKMYKDRNDAYDEEFKKKHKTVVMIGNGALVLMILNIVANIVERL